MTGIGLATVPADASPTAEAPSGFALDPRQAGLLSTEVNKRLVSSLHYVFDRLGADLGCDTSDFRAWLGRLDPAQCLPPAVHALFHSVVAAVESGDWDAASRLAARLPAFGATGDRLTVAPVEAEEESARSLSLFSRFADIEEDNNLDFSVPEPEDVARASVYIEEALGLIQRNDPDLDAELRALIAEILLAAQGPDHLFLAGAVSCFQNWGALLVNPAVQRGPLDIVELLAHESTHLLLFAFALDEPLLTNPPELRYYSPLREAMRSMDGVYHATIVSARIARAMLRQAHASGADPDLYQAALERVRRSAGTFDEGVEIIEADAQLTPLGRGIFDEARLYMDTLRPVLAATG